MFWANACRDCIAHSNQKYSLATIWIPFEPLKNEPRRVANIIHARNSAAGVGEGGGCRCWGGSAAKAALLRHAQGEGQPHIITTHPANVVVTVITALHSHSARTGFEHLLMSAFFPLSLRRPIGMLHL